MNAEAEGRAAAQQFRRDHHLGRQPLGDLVVIIEQSAGIDVAILDADPHEHGLAMRDPKRGAVFIGVARTRRPMRQRSTLAHELGHVLFDDWTDIDSGNWSERSPGETRADAFARHLLLPVEGLPELLGKPRAATLITLSTVVQRFLVSPAIAAIVLEQAGYIDLPTKQSWRTISARQLAARFGWSDQYYALQTDADQRRAPQRLLTRAIRGYAEGVVSVQALATLRGTSPESIAAELREAGIVPAHHPVVWAEPEDLPEVQVDLDALDDDLYALGDSSGNSAEPDVR